MLVDVREKRMEDGGEELEEEGGGQMEEGVTRWRRRE
jgi:hypothetical protein